VRFATISPDGSDDGTVRIIYKTLTSPIYIIVVQRCPNLAISDHLLRRIFLAGRVPHLCYWIVLAVDIKTLVNTLQLHPFDELTTNQQATVFISTVHAGTLFPSTGTYHIMAPLSETPENHMDHHPLGCMCPGCSPPLSSNAPNASYHYCHSEDFSLSLFLENRCKRVYFIRYVLLYLYINIAFLICREHIVSQGHNHRTQTTIYAAES
jgi:hypothetical protein